MIANDEIRKALVDAAEQGMNTIRSLIHTLETIDSDERSLARDERRSARVHTSEIRQSHAAHDKIAAALAPYLAPHPAQQGEDGIAELERKLRQSQQKYSDGFECVPFCELSGEVERFLAARSHSKQEGGA